MGAAGPYYQTLPDYSFSGRHMGQIALLINDLTSNKAVTITNIRATLEVPVTDILRLVAAGRPVFVKRLFDRADPQFPQRLLQLLEAFENRRQSHWAYEIPNGENFDPSKSTLYYQITAERQHKLITTRAASLAEQRRFGQLEEGSLE